MLLLHILVPSFASTIPLQNIDWEVTATGPIADIRVRQVFKNTDDQFINAQYVFPLYESAAVDEMSIWVGNRHIVGRIEDRDLAREAYEAAKDRGQVAGLTEQQRPNVFTQEVANIPPGAQITVDLHLVQPVEWVNDHYELTLPLVVGPRFSPESVPDVAAITPSVSPTDTGLRVNIGVDILSGTPLDWLASPTHTLDGDGAIRDTGATLEVTGIRATRDFVLQWAPVADGPTPLALHQDGHVMVEVLPPRAPKPEHLVPREIIWVVDTSGSMSGAPLDLCKRAMSEAFSRMDDRDSFLVLNFSDTVSTLAPTPLPATAENIERGRQFVEHYSARGGTRMLNGIQAALDLPHDPDRERFVVFMTDGYIGNEREIFAAIEDRIGEARLFSFGVGSSVNRYLIQEMARSGRGKSTIVTLEASPEAAVSTLLDTLDRPALSDITIDWGDWEVADVHPRRIPDLFAGQPLRITARANAIGGPITLRGRLGNGLYEQELVPTDAEREGVRGVGIAWARTHVAALEREQHWGEIPEVADAIRALALHYGLLTRYTSFVAIEQVLSNPDGNARDVEVPVDIPDGVNFQTSVSRRHTPPGDPLLTVDAPEDARSVVAVFPWETAHLSWDPLRERWYYRFLVPRDMPESSLTIRILIELADGRTEERVEVMHVDATAPELDVTVTHAKGTTVVTVAADEPFRSLQVEPIGQPHRRIRREFHPEDDAHGHVFHLPGEWTAVRVIAKDRAMNTVEVIRDL